MVITFGMHEKLGNFELGNYYIKDVSVDDLIELFVNQPSTPRYFTYNDGECDLMLKLFPSAKEMSKDVYKHIRDGMYEYI